MEKTHKGLPLLDATLEDWELGIYCLSLVDSPATQRSWLLFSNKNKNKQPKTQPLKFAVTDAKEHKVLSVIMLADTPIYRIDEKGDPYYLQFSKKTLYEAAHRMLLNGFQNNRNIEHIDSSVVYGFDMVQLFQKDTAKGLSPVGFEDVPDGSLFGEFYVTDETLWQEILSDKFTGLSLEGQFGVEDKPIESIEELIQYLGIK